MEEYKKLFSYNATKMASKMVKLIFIRTILFIMPKTRLPRCFSESSLSLSNTLNWKRLDKEKILAKLRFNEGVAKKNLPKSHSTHKCSREKNKLVGRNFLEKP